MLDLLREFAKGQLQPSDSNAELSASIDALAMQLSNADLAPIGDGNLAQMNATGADSQASVVASMEHLAEQMKKLSQA